jgi:hypothetical protein
VAGREPVPVGHGLPDQPGQRGERGERVDRVRHPEGDGEQWVRVVGRLTTTVSSARHVSTARARVT